ncbi:MAG: rod shape-determining protein RodA [Salinivirgaceae bacterium]|nr:rod shape-determining protein RodA [Salinivirgaceae bacterium]MDD4745879.1 rod shape-determining protein RodA [Salinivirgaceae bacterium]MDY0278944.1 rod shape-determining protein RodA [Salinivirgaceae bacterium]
MFKRQPTKLWNSIDWITVLLYTILVVMGWFNIYAAVYNEEYQSIFDISQKYGRQMLWIIAAIVLIIAILLIDGKIYVFFAYPIYITTILMLIAVLLFGVEINASKSWFEIGGLRIQPAEFAKISTILAIANFLSDSNRRLMNFRSLLVVGAFIALPAGLILLQNDTGTMLVFTALVFMLHREGLPGWIIVIAFFSVFLFIVALTNPFWIVIVIVMVTCYIYILLRHPNKIEILIYGGATAILIPAALLTNHFANLEYAPHWILIGYPILSIPIVLYYSFLRKTAYIVGVWGIAFMLIGFSFSVDYIYDNILQDHQRNRIDHVLGINFDPLGAGYNVNQSKIAIGSGGMWGKGFLQGTQTKYDFVPEQSTDFIFCTIGEEWGFVGSTVVVLLFLTLMLRLIYLAERQRSKFSRIYGYGVVSILFFHVAINIGMTIGITPVIGIPLPFFSYGGSSLWAFTILLFVFVKLDASRADLIK